MGLIWAANQAHSMSFPPGGRARRDESETSPEPSSSLITHHSSLVEHVGVHAIQRWLAGQHVDDVVDRHADHLRVRLVAEARHVGRKDRVLSLKNLAAPGRLLVEDV